MKVDRSNLDIEHFFPPFFSVLLPELGRPDMVIKCVNHLLRYADMPMEIILHDDGSSKEKQQRLFDELREKVSTIIFNTLSNTGLHSSMNRCRKMASSKYLLGFNIDDYVTSPFLKKIKTALDLPYVGIVNVVEKVNGEKGDQGIYVAPDGTRMAICGNEGTFHLYGIRAETWDKVGGWDENIQTTSSDGEFGGRIFSHGYFNVYVEGTYYNDMWSVREDGKANGDGGNPDYEAACRYADGDNNMPRLLNFDKRLHKELCKKREEAVWHGVNDEILRDKNIPTWTNGEFSAHEVPRLFNHPDTIIDWEFAKKYGHDKWKDMIIKDFNLEKE